MNIAKKEIKQTNYVLTLTREELRYLSMVIGQTTENEDRKMGYSVGFGFKLYDVLDNFCTKHNINLSF